MNGNCFEDYPEYQREMLKSAYEIAREERIRRNNEILRQMEIESLGENVAVAKENKEKMYHLLTHGMHGNGMDLMLLDQHQIHTMKTIFIITILPLMVQLKLLDFLIVHTEIMH